jgi:hypothetical protein
MTSFCNAFYLVSFLIRVVLRIRINFSLTDFQLEPDKRPLFLSSKLSVKTLDYFCIVKSTGLYPDPDGSAILALLDPDMDLYWEYRSGSRRKKNCPN